MVVFILQEAGIRCLSGIGTLLGGRISNVLSRFFGRIAKEAGIPTLATGFIEDRDRNLYEASGFQVYSFFQIFHGLDMRDYGYNPANTATHFSDKGSDFIGRSLAFFI